MPTLNLSTSVTGLDLNLSASTPRTADGGGNREIPVPVAKAGTLTTRTDDNTGTLTMGAGHGISTAEKVDLFWSGGSRYNVTVGTVSGNTVPIDLGSGDNLPLANTAIAVSRSVSFLCDIFDTLEALAAQQTYLLPTETAYSWLVLYTATTVVAAYRLTAFEPKLIDVVGGDANPISLDVDNARISNGSTTNAATFKLLWVQDNTP